MSALWTFPCDAEDCTPATSRPYSRDRAYPSATTLIGLLDKPGLSWAAAKETAVYCLNRQRELAQMEYLEAVDKARKHHSILWREAANMGTVTHEAAVAFASGREFTLPDDLSDDAAAQVATFIGGLTRWWEKVQPEVIACELIVRRDNPNVIGSLDMLCRVEGEIAVVDFKNTKRLDGDPYLGDWGRQLGTYMACDTLCHYHGGKLAATLPWVGTLPAPEAGFIVNIMGDGRVRMYRFNRSDDSALAQVAALAAVKSYKPACTAMGELPAPEKYEPRPEARVNVEAML